MSAPDHRNPGEGGSRQRSAPKPPGMNTGRLGAANQARAWAIGLNFVYGVIGFALIGWAVQRWIWPSAAPWPMLVGLFLGLLGGGFRFIKDAMSMGRR